MARRIVFWMVMVLLGTAVVRGQIVGGAEQARFEPGDRTLWAQDFSAIAIGEPAPDLQLKRGSYEIAEFQGKKWLRPLDTGLGLVKPLRLPKEFSLEFVFHAFEKGGPRMWLYLHSARGVTEWGIQGGPRFVQLEVGQEHKTYVELRLSAEFPKASVNFPQKTARTELEAGKSHHVALQVRRGQLRVFVDGKRMVVVPFRPAEPIVGLGFYWYRHFSDPTPYRDAPVLITDLRVAAYTQREAVRGQKPTVQLQLVLDPAKVGKDHPLRKVLMDLRARETQQGWWIPLPAEPFAEAGTWEVGLKSQAAMAWRNTLRDLLAQAVRVDSNAHLSVGGRAPEVAGSQDRQTTFWGRQVPFWLAALRARALALWLVEGGISPDRIRVIP